MNTVIVNTLGLILSTTGFIIFALGLIVSTKRAIEVSVSRISEVTGDDNIKLPGTKDRIRESRYALWGAIMFVIGMLIQIVAAILG